MGLFSRDQRSVWKKAVAQEVQKRHGLDLYAVGKATIGRSTLEDILNFQYEYAPESPQLGATNVEKVLYESFQVDLHAMAMEARIFGAK